MDLYAEKQCVDNMKEGDKRQFLLLFDANFADLYKYIARRVFDREEVEKIIRLTFLDALGQIQDTPADVSYLIWLYSLAKPRIWDYIAASSFPEKQGLISVSEKRGGGGEGAATKVDAMLKKLSLEEREIVRLKFFEQVADGDLITILGIEEGQVGSKIYRVLKRVHLLMFGESDEKKGAYFGELSGLFEKVRRLEEIEVPEVLKLSMKADITGRIDREDRAIDGEYEKSADGDEDEVPNFEEAKGSNDPAKIFVEAVKEMKEDEDTERLRQQEALDRSERIYDTIDKWKGVLAVIPVVLFIWIVTFVVFNVFNVFGGVERGYPTICEIEVEYEADFADGVRRGLDIGVVDRICGHFEGVESIVVSELEGGVIGVEVELTDMSLEYKFVSRNDEWRVNKFAKTFSSDSKSG